VKKRKNPKKEKCSDGLTECNDTLSQKVKDLHFHGKSRRLSIDTADTLNLKEQALRLYLENPYHTAKSLCQIMELDYSTYGHTLRTYIWEFKRQLKNGSLQSSHNNQPVSHRRVFECLLKVDLSEEREKAALKVGWKKTSNRNRMLRFKGLNGSVVWYRNGHVLIFLQGMAPLARALELFWAGLGFLGDKECDRLSKMVVSVRRHTFFDFGIPFPRFDIRYYEATLGLRLVSDGTHPKGFEAIETEPFWLNRLDEVADKFGRHMDRHEHLVNTLAEESEARRRLYELEANRRQDNVLASERVSNIGEFQRLCIC